MPQAVQLDLKEVIYKARDYLRNSAITTDDRAAWRGMTWFVNFWEGIESSWARESIQKILEKSFDSKNLFQIKLNMPFFQKILKFALDSWGGIFSQFTVKVGIWE